MKKLVILYCLLSFIIISCKKETANYSREEIDEDSEGQQIPLACGMEEAMAKLSPEMRNAMMSAGRTEARATELLLFLDFDGAVVRPGFPNTTGLFSTIVNGVRNCPPPVLTEQQKQKLVKLVTDDYSPFKIVVTTDQAAFDAYPFQNKQLCIITTTPSVIGFPNGIGGVSPFAGPGTRLFCNPSFVFSSVYGDQLDDLAMTISHETGHGMGLDHQNHFDAACAFLAEYHPGFGNNGPLSFAPIMGGGTRKLTNWFAQSCLSPVSGLAQNDFELLNSQVDLKQDDFPNSATGAAQAAQGEINGILEQAGDVDFIRINFKKPGEVKIRSKNIDIKVSVYNAGGHLLETYNEPHARGVIIPGVNGNRYLKIEAASNAHMSSQFMTGQYKIIY